MPSKIKKPVAPAKKAWNPAATAIKTAQGGAYGGKKKFSPVSTATRAAQGGSYGGGSKNKNTAIRAATGAAYGGATSGGKTKAAISNLVNKAATGSSGGTGGGGGGTSYSGPVGGTSSVGIGTPTGPVGSTMSNPVTVGAQTPSQVAALALASKMGGGNAGSFARRRNRAGAGFNLSLTPEQLRNIAARRMGS